MTEDSSRPYRKVARARQEAETRRRITEAAVELHGTLGPASTTVTDVAKLAGVSRMTVYNHFPTDVDLFAACSTHWATRNPFPDPSSWTKVEDPAERLAVALAELYEWYGLKEDMLGKVFRDMPMVPGLAEVMEGLWTGYVEGVVDTLAAGWPPPEGDSDGLRAALRLAIDFHTWRVLSGPDPKDGGPAELAARLVLGAFGARIAG